MKYEIMLKVILCLILGICSITDILWKKIWMPLLMAAVPIILVCIAVMGNGLGGHIICGIIWGALFVGISVVTGGGMELGDGAVFGVMGLALGMYQSILFIICSFVYAFLAALFLVVVMKKKKSYRMPFLPFILAGYLTLCINSLF